VNVPALRTQPTSAKGWFATDRGMRGTAVFCGTHVELQQLQRLAFCASCFASRAQTGSGQFASVALVWIRPLQGHGCARVGCFTMVVFF